MSDKSVVTVSFVLSRKVGQDTLEWRAAANATVGNETAVYDHLHSVVDGVSRAWVGNFAAGRSGLNAGDSASGAGGHWLVVDRVSVVVDNGKRYVKLHCGRWSKHGVTVWPEVLERASINAENIPDAGFTPKTWKACIVAEEGKPPRCINVTHEKDSRGIGQ